MDTLGNALSFSNVVSVLERKGTTSDKAGYVYLQLAADDSILISTVGYRKQIWPVAEILKTDTIRMVAEVRELQNVRIINFNQFKNFIEAGFFNGHEPHSWQFMPGSQFAIFMKNPLQKMGWVKKVKIKMKSEGSCPINFRLRFLEWDSINNSPGNDLIKESIIVPVEKQKRHTIIDVSKYHIVFPTNGFFVMLEWLKEENPCSKKIAEKEVAGLRRDFHTTIFATFKNTGAPVFTNYLDKGWVLLHPVHHDTVLTPDVGIEGVY
ncbi:MAG: hypothetical protein JSS98_19580 [Bacteroidetes bacterium]|nr:hypothetical protein [Bacteroidota bacterium]